MKRRIIILAIIIIVFSIAIFSFWKKYKVIGDGKAIIWEVKSDTSTVYLVGSIHVAKEDTYPLKSVLMNSFNKSDILAVEMDMVEYQKNLPLQFYILNYYTYDDGSTIKDHLTEETFNLLDEYLNNTKIKGVSKSTAYNYKPVMLYSLISTQIYEDAGYKSKYGIDLFFLNEAYKRKMEIVEIESAYFQVELLTELSDELQELLLLSTLMESEEKQLKSVEKMLKAWIDGNYSEFEKMLNETENPNIDSMTDEEKEIYEEYNQKFYINRNIAMTDKVEEFLKGNKDVFYVVGSAHMFGDSGIVKLLEDRGYTVTKKIGK